MREGSAGVCMTTYLIPSDLCAEMSHGYVSRHVPASMCMLGGHIIGLPFRWKV